MALYRTVFIRENIILVYDINGPKHLKLFIHEIGQCRMKAILLRFQLKLRSTDSSFMIAYFVFALELMSI